MTCHWGGGGLRRGLPHGRGLARGHDLFCLPLAVPIGLSPLHILTRGGGGGSQLEEGDRGNLITSDPSV